MSTIHYYRTKTGERVPYMKTTPKMTTISTATINKGRIK